MNPILETIKPIRLKMYQRIAQRIGCSTVEELILLGREDIKSGSYSDEECIRRAIASHLGLSSQFELIRFLMFDMTIEERIALHKQTPLDSIYWEDWLESPDREDSIEDLHALLTNLGIPDHIVLPEENIPETKEFPFTNTEVDFLLLKDLIEQLKSKLPLMANEEILQDIGRYMLSAFNLGRGKSNYLDAITKQSFKLFLIHSNNKTVE